MHMFTFGFRFRLYVAYLLDVALNVASCSFESDGLQTHFFFQDTYDFICQINSLSLKDNCTKT